MACGLSCPAACGIFLDQGSNQCPLHQQADSQPWGHQGSPCANISLNPVDRCYYDFFFLFRWDNWGLERLSNFPKATQDLRPAILTQESVLLVTTQRHNHRGPEMRSRTHTWQRQREFRLTLSPVWIPFCFRERDGLIAAMTRTECYF